MWEQMYFIITIRHIVLELELLMVLYHNCVPNNLYHFLIDGLAIVIKEPLVIFIPDIVGDAATSKTYGTLN